MLKACVRRVGNFWITVGWPISLPTAAWTIRRALWVKAVVITSRVNTKAIQFYTTLGRQLHLLVSHFSPLSTSLIIEPIWVTKDNSLISRRG